MNGSRVAPTAPGHGGGILDTAMRVALAVRAQYGWRGAPTWRQLLVAARDLGATVDAKASLPAPVREVYVDGLFGLRRTIALQAGLAPHWRRWLLAHAAGHMLLHRGNHAYMEAVDGAGVDRQEAEAEVFAGFVLLGDDPLERAAVVVDALGTTVDAGAALDLAERTNLPFTCVARWLRLSAGAAAALPTVARLMAAMLAGVMVLHDLNGDGVMDAVATGMMHLGRLVG